MGTNAPRVLEGLRDQRGVGPAGDLYDANCSCRVVMERMGDKWTTLVVMLLSDGPMRFSELRTALGSVTPKVLTQTLRRLERDGLVTRHIYAEVPPRVEYTITDLGRSLTGPIAVLGDWAETHMSDILQAQQEYDAR